MFLYCPIPIEIYFFWYFLLKHTRNLIKLECPKLMLTRHLDKINFHYLSHLINQFYI